MADDHNGLVEKAKEVKEDLGDKLEPTDEELRKHGYRGPGGTDGESEAVVENPTSS